ncbi:MAG: hypothetical protein CME65_09355 [Halobacteriovoraceae bacterium]|nr:hypothetical protein [Halobacteriovoraceae bacterium]|tara:strand:+ start:3540 stop:4028 length:489 start_codon:yes stop_codon:yes gene_type:complete
MVAMTRFFTFFFTALFFISSAVAQDLLKERIWKISDRKRSVFLDRGVFHSEANPVQQELKDIRNSYVPSRGYERVVFDFSSAKPPRVYGKISSEEKKVYLDFFNTSIGTSISELKNIKYLKNIDFFTIDEDNISVELFFKDNVSFDVFYLENPGRLVVDVKK